MIKRVIVCVLTISVLLCGCGKNEDNDSQVSSVKDTIKLELPSSTNVVDTNTYETEQSTEGKTYTVNEVYDLLQSYNIPCNISYDTEESPYGNYVSLIMEIYGTSLNILIDDTEYSNVIISNYKFMPPEECYDSFNRYDDNSYTYEKGSRQYLEAIELGCIINAEYQPEYHDAMLELFQEIRTLLGTGNADKQVFDNCTLIHGDYIGNSFTMSGEEFVTFCENVFPYGQIDLGNLNQCGYKYLGGNIIVPNDDAEYKRFIELIVDVPDEDIDFKIYKDCKESDEEYFPYGYFDDDSFLRYVEEGDYYEEYDGREIIGLTFIRGNVIIDVNTMRLPESMNSVIAEYIVDNFKDFDYIVNYNDVSDMYVENRDKWLAGEAELYTYDTYDDLDKFEQFISDNFNQ